MPERGDLFCSPAEIVSQKAPAVLVVVAVDAEILPIGPVRRIVVVVTVSVVHGQKMPVRVVEFPAALSADEPVNP